MLQFFIYFFIFRFKYWFGIFIFLSKFSMNFSPDFFRTLSSAPFRPHSFVKHKIFYLSLQNSKRRFRFLQNNNSHKRPKNKLTKQLSNPTFSNSNK